MKNKVFLGGTCNQTTWRDELIPMLDIDFFNPVVEDWTEECQEIERKEKNLCNIHLYLINKKMSGVFSIAEMIDSAHDPDRTTIAIFNPEGFSKGQIKSFDATIEMILDHGEFAVLSSDLKRVALLINEIGEG